MKRETKERIKRNRAHRDPSIRTWNIKRTISRGHFWRASAAQATRNIIDAFKMYRELAIAFSGPRDFYTKELY